MYVCLYCKKELSCQSALNRHIRTTRSCIKLQLLVQQQNDSFKCEYCTKSFSTKYTLRNHRNRCQLHQLYQIRDVINIKTMINKLENDHSSDIDDLEPKVSCNEENFEGEKLKEESIVKDTDKKQSIYNGYIYLIQEREFKILKQPIYKIGMSCQSDPIKRVQHYPKNSNLICIIKVSEPRNVETALCKLLGEKFANRTDIGREYFEGNVRQITSLIYKYILELNE